MNTAETKEAAAKAKFAKQQANTISDLNAEIKELKDVITKLREKASSAEDKALLTKAHTHVTSIEKAVEVIAAPSSGGGTALSIHN